MQKILLHLKEAIGLRHSVRSFNGKPINGQERQQLDECARLALEFFDASNSRIEIVDSATESSAPSTYGFIGGCCTYMILISTSHKRGDRVRAAAAMEICVLEATRLGLGTCWVGGTFKRSSFADACRLGANEEILAIVPCGIPAKPRLRDRLMVAVARSHSRKDQSMLFFDKNLSTSLPATSPLYNCLEYVRLAPSSTNSQPWRIIAIDDHSFDLCSATDNRYTDLDMGIALGHIFIAFAPEAVKMNSSEASYPKLITYARITVVGK